jgi:hypothetical protein
LIAELDDVQRDATDPLDALAKPLERYIRFGLRHPNEYELTFVARQSKELENLKPKNEKLGMQAFERFYDCVDAVVRAKVTNESDTQLLTQQLWAACHGLVALLLLRPEFPWADLDTLISGHVGMLLRGVSTRSC